MVVFDPQSQQYVNIPDPPSIRLPFLRQQIGAGDVISAATQAVGISHCSPCEQRRKWLNSHLTFSPWGT